VKAATADAKAAKNREARQLKNGNSSKRQFKQTATT
jgi:hypothetical protein